MFKGIKRILVIKLKHIGDVLLTTPAIRALKENLPDSEIYVLVPKGTEEVIAGNPDVKGILTLDRDRGLGPWRRLWDGLRLAREIRRLGFDLVLETGKGDREAILGILSGARYRVGYEPKGSGFLGRGYLLTHRVTLDHGKHIVEANLDLCRTIGLEPKEKDLKLAVSSKEMGFVEGLLQGEGVLSGDLLVTIHPVSKWLFKCWRDEGFAAVADYLVERYRARVAITSGPAEGEVKKARRVVDLMKTPPIDLVGQLSIKELAALISRSRLFLGVDSAPMHIAAAVKTPVIALFGPSGEHNWGPWGEGHIVIKKDMDCRPCGKDGCNGTKRATCLEMITTEEVIAAVDEQLSKVKQPLAVSP